MLLLVLGIQAIRQQIPFIVLYHQCQATESRYTDIGFQQASAYWLMVAVILHAAVQSCVVQQSQTTNTQNQRACLVSRHTSFRFDMTRASPECQHRQTVKH